MCFCVTMPALFSKFRQAKAPEFDQVALTCDDIEYRCIQAFKTSPDSLSNPAYLPRDTFKDFLSAAQVKATIGKYAPSTNKQEKDRLFEYARQNPIIFLTLASTQLVNKIKLLQQAQVEDRHLPVRKIYDPRTQRLQIFPSEDSINDASQHLSGFVTNWNSADLKQFVLNQWLFYAVVFEKSRFLYEGLSHPCPLPFVELSTGAAGGGHFGKVFRVGLRMEHVKPDHAHFPYLRQVSKSKLCIVCLQHQR